MFTEYSEDEALPRRLWLQVILRAVEDAKGQDLMCETEEWIPQLVREAREWLTTNSWEFRTVCELAGMDAREALRKFREKYPLGGEHGNSEGW